MGKIFHHHIVNDLVRVGDGDATYADTADSFAADGGVATALPPGAIERIYEPGVRHAISNGNTVIAGGPMPWAPGDAAIGAVSKLLAAQAKRTAPLPPPQPSQTKRSPTPAPAATGKSSGTATVAS